MVKKTTNSKKTSPVVKKVEEKVIAIPCKWCDGDTYFITKVGALKWYQCRQCGRKFSV